jgi:hypothetical protein
MAMKRKRVDPATAECWGFTMGESWICGAATPDEALAVVRAQSKPVDAPTCWRLVCCGQHPCLNWYGGIAFLWARAAAERCVAERPRAFARGFVEGAREVWSDFERDLDVQPGAADPKVGHAIVYHRGFCAAIEWLSERNRRSHACFAALRAFGVYELPKGIELGFTWTSLCHAVPEVCAVECLVPEVTRLGPYEASFVSGFLESAFRAACRVIAN